MCTHMYDMCVYGGGCDTVCACDVYVVCMSSVCVFVYVYGSGLALCVCDIYVICVCGVWYMWFLCQVCIVCV